VCVGHDDRLQCRSSSEVEVRVSVQNAVSRTSILRRGQFSSCLIAGHVCVVYVKQKYMSLFVSGYISHQTCSIVATFIMESCSDDQRCVTVRPMDNDDSESEESRRSKDGSDWPASQDSASQSVDDDVAERADDESRQQHRHEVNEAKRAKLREIEVMMLTH